KLTYFNVSMRGEPARLALTIGGIPFEDERINGESWPALKSTTPFGQLPFLTVNGTTRVAQSGGILRYAGALANLYPCTDPLKAALVDQVVFHVDDISNAVYCTIHESDAAKKSLARKTLAESKWPQMFASLERVITQHSGGKWAVGDSMTVADIQIYVIVSLISSGLWDGIPTDLTEKYSKVHAIYKAVQSHPKVVEW
ncbi:hypothetical protein BATDEDRAFT_6133, partial [Batrachochytrium dendrobatidis JAM81]